MSGAVEASIDSFFGDESPRPNEENTKTESARSEQESVQSRSRSSSESSDSSISSTNSSSSAVSSVSAASTARSSTYSSDNEETLNPVDKKIDGDILNEGNLLVKRIIRLANAI